MSLQNLCLDTIVEKFEVHFSALTNSDDVNLKRKFEFLQRIYSQEVANKLFQEFEIEEKHVDFVINKYLKSLDSKWFENCSWESVIAKMAEIGPEIKKINICNVSEVRPWHEIFCYLPNLEVMHNHHDCFDETLKSIAEYCSNVQEIDIRYSIVTDNGFKSLCMVKNGNVSCSKLKNIIIDSHIVSYDAAKYLIKTLQSLEVFNYKPLPRLLYAVHQKDIPTIDKKIKVTTYKFTKLVLLVERFWPHYEDLLKVCFSLCPNLKHLFLPVMKPQQLDLVSELSNLETLHIVNCNKDNFIDINDFLKLRGSKLTSLQLRKCLVSLTILEKDCPSLNQLHLVNVKCDEASIPPFKNLKALTIEKSELGISDENLKSACLILSSSPKLESMAFKNCDLALSGVKTAIIKCCEQSPIKKIIFSRSTVEMQFILDILFTCHSLLYFNLYHCGNIDKKEIDKCVELLPNNPHISFSLNSSHNCFAHDENYDDDDDYYMDDYDPYFELFEVWT